MANLYKVILVFVISPCYVSAGHFRSAIVEAEEPVHMTQAQILFKRKTESLRTKYIYMLSQDPLVYQPRSPRLCPRLCGPRLQGQQIT